jgi:hypothetical protein
MFRRPFEFVLLYIYALHLMLFPFSSYSISITFRTYAHRLGLLYLHLCCHSHAPPLQSPLQPNDFTDTGKLLKDYVSVHGIQSAMFASSIISTTIRHAFMLSDPYILGVQLLFMT